MRTLGIDYGDSRVGIAISDALGITAQGLETIHHKGNDKIILRRLDEIMQEYEIDTIVVIIPISEVVYILVIIIEPINPIICPNIDPEVNKRIDLK